MTPHPYTEDQLVEQPALALLSELGWTTVNARDEELGPSGTLGRETTSEVVLVSPAQHSPRSSHRKVTRHISLP